MVRHLFKHEKFTTNWYDSFLQCTPGLKDTYTNLLSALRAAADLGGGLFFCLPSPFCNILKLSLSVLSPCICIIDLCCSSSSSSSSESTSGSSIKFASSVSPAVDINVRDYQNGAHKHWSYPYFNWKLSQIEHVNEYPTMHYFGIPRHTRSTISYTILTEYFWKSQWNIALWECC